MGLPVQYAYAQLASWAWYYAQRFTQRTLPQHWSAFRWCADVDGKVFPLPDSVCWRRMRRVMRALRLRDPTVERRSFALVWRWIRKMMAVDGIRTVQQLQAGLSLAKTIFWARTVTAHTAMMRACEHEEGMSVTDLTLHATPGSVGHGYWTHFYELAVGAAPLDLQPQLATNRKLKLRAARSCILPTWTSLQSAGLWLHVLGIQVRTAWAACGHPSPHPADEVIFPSVVGGQLVNRPQRASDYLSQLRRLARCAGMPAADVARLEQRSLRAGGCTDAFAWGMPRASIMRQGGWTSDTVDIYNRPTVTDMWSCFSRFWHVVPVNRSSSIAS